MYLRAPDRRHADVVTRADVHGDKPTLHVYVEQHPRVYVQGIMVFRKYTNYRAESSDKESGTEMDPASSARSNSTGYT